jgi:5-methylcytosine-specific restriction endonuclease McrA
MANNSPSTRLCKKINKRTRYLIYELDRHECVYCGRTADLTLDHIVPACSITLLMPPRIVNHAINLVTSCGPCNHGMLIKPKEWMLRGRFRAPVLREEYAKRVWKALYVLATKP